MKVIRPFVAFAVVSAVFAFVSANCFAQQVSGDPGAPGTTITISGKQLPPPPPAFGGVIKENADAPTRHTTQYFEMLGNRAIYHEGWVAATTPVTIPWLLSTDTPPDVISGYQ